MLSSPLSSASLSEIAISTVVHVAFFVGDVIIVIGIIIGVDIRVVDIFAIIAIDVSCSWLDWIIAGFLMWPSWLQAWNFLCHLSFIGDSSFERFLKEHDAKRLSLMLAMGFHFMSDAGCYPYFVRTNYPK